MKRLLTLLTVLFCATLSAFAQGDSPYARFGYEGKVLRTPQERQQRMMLVVSNPDTTATVAKVGLDPAKQRYYLFDKQNKVLTSDTLAGTTVSRFLSVDPLTKQYPELTPYQFASNTPLWAIDRDGEEARIYTETTGTGHTFLTVQSGNDLILYTFGRYAESNWYTLGTTGPGVLIKYTGEQANNYLKTELFRMGAKAFEIKNADECKVAASVDAKYNSSSMHPNSNNPDVKKYGRVVGTYSLFGNNCTSSSCDYLKDSGSDIFDNRFGYDYDEDFTIPSSLQGYLTDKSKTPGSSVVDVTEQMKTQYSSDQSRIKGVGSSGATSGSSGDSSGSSVNNSGVNGSSSGNGSGSLGSGSGSSSSQNHDRQ